MVTNTELETQFKEFNEKRREQGKQPLTFGDWYKKRYKTEPPHFVDQEIRKNNLDIDEYLRNNLGREPYVNNAKRRWRFLISFSKFVYEKQEINFNTVIKWFAVNGEVMKPRTIKESYLDYLETLGVIIWNENTKMVKWRGEEVRFD
jgi:hypothetical protein